jgi:hypothetical protein
MSSTIIHVATTKPDKRLVREHKYKAYLSPDQKRDIMQQLKDMVPNLDNYIVSMHVDIDLKLYDTKDT